MGTEKEARVDVETEMNDDGVYQEKMTAKEWIADKWNRHKKKIILIGALGLGALLGAIALAHKDDDDDAIDLLATGSDDDDNDNPESIETTTETAETETTETETEAA